MVRFDFKEKRWQHADSLLTRNVPLQKAFIPDSLAIKYFNTHHFRLKNQEVMEFLKFRRFSQDALRHIELPRQTVGIPEQS